MLGSRPASVVPHFAIGMGCYMHNKRRRLPDIKRPSVACLLLLAALAHQATASQSTAQISLDEINERVIASLPTLDGKNADIVDDVDLTRPFATRTQWTFVVASLPGSQVNAVGDTITTESVAVCFVDRLTPHCDQYSLSDAASLTSADVVFSDPGHTDPLLLVRARSIGGADGNHSIDTQVYMFDRPSKQFRLVFSNQTGSNNNQRTRFVQDGPPLRGDIIVDEPTQSAPFGYWISVYAWNREKPYSDLALRYRSETRYGDGNPLPVIDSEMRNILKRLGKWKVGDPLPIPPQSTCVPYLRGGGEEWCR